MPRRVFTLLTAVVERGKLRVQIRQGPVQLLGVALVLADFQVALHASPGKQQHLFSPAVFGLRGR